jgi:hypothetical protein
MGKNIRKYGISVAIAATAMAVAYPAMAQEQNICQREARTFNEWVIQIFTCR